MQKLFKLTEQDHTTYNGKTKWGTNVTHVLPEKNNPQLCSSDVLHAYSNVNLAFLLNPLHAGITKPVLWEAKGSVVANDFGKVGCFKLTTVKELPYPAWVGSEKEKLVRVAFAVLCAESVLVVYEKHDSKDNRVKGAIASAKEYLKNPSDAADAAAYAAYAAADAAAYAAAYAAARAADAAYAAADAARAADAAYAAAYAAYAAADAAYAVEGINFGELADKAVEMVMEAKA